jgi:ornithine carbamoyltransferase
MILRNHPPERVSFEVGMWQLGGYASFKLNDLNSTRRNNRRYGSNSFTVCQRDHGKGLSHQTILDLIKYSRVPVVNGLSDFSHPCQGLADIFTIYEKKGHLSGLKLAYIGDGNNVAHSLIYGCSKMGMDIFLGCPRGYEPDPSLRMEGEEAKRTEGSDRDQ